MKFLRAIPLAVVVLLVFAATAFAGEGTHDAPFQALPQSQLWCVVIGALTPIVAYVLNSAFAKRMTAGIPEPVLSMTHVAVAAIGAAIYTMAETNTFGWNTMTLQLLLSAVATAFAAHGLVWKPSGVQARLAKHQG